MIRPYKHILGVMILVITLFFFFTTCVEGPAGDGHADVRGKLYAGSAACASCHRGIHDSSLHSSHFLTMQPASKEGIMGSFVPPGNEFHYNGGRRVIMEARDSGLFQVGMVGDRIQAVHRFDMVMGSGRKGQTYLYWQGDTVKQLPVSYFRMAGGWGNSPLYSMDTIWYDRRVSFECFACHTTYIGMKKPVQINTFRQLDQYDREKIVYGIDCERCHGPAAAHVRYQQEHPDVREAKYIVRWGSLSQQQRVDVCGICHSGAHGFMRSMFWFKPGDTLTNYFYPEVGTPKTDAMDVHGNQYGLLVASKCFERSKTLECATCHDTHTADRKSLADYSVKCMACHGAAEVKKVHKNEDAGLLTTNCIDCHMPVGESKLINIQRDAGTNIMAHLARRHLIAVYPEAAKRWKEAQAAGVKKSVREEGRQ